MGADDEELTDADMAAMSAVWREFSSELDIELTDLDVAWQRSLRPLEPGVEKVMAAARASVLVATTGIELMLEEAVAAYWTAGYEDEAEFFIEAVLRNATASANLDRLKAIVRHYLADDQYDDLWGEVRRVLEYRNLLVHPWRHVTGYNYRTDVVSLRRLRADGQMAEEEVSAARTTEVCDRAAKATLRLVTLRQRLAEMGHHPRD